MKVIISVSYGSDDPTKATLGMMAAKVAADQGHEVTIWLQGEGVHLANKFIYPTLQGVNMPPMAGVMEAVLQKNIPLWVCEACAKGRNVTPDNTVATASFKGMGDYVQAALGMEKSLHF